MSTWMKILICFLSRRYGQLLAFLFLLACVFTSVRVQFLTFSALSTPVLQYGHSGFNSSNNWLSFKSSSGILLICSTFHTNQHGSHVCWCRHGYRTTFFFRSKHKIHLKQSGSISTSSCSKISLNLLRRRKKAGPLRVTMDITWSVWSSDSGSESCVASCAVYPFFGRDFLVSLFRSGFARAFWLELASDFIYIFTSLTHIYNTRARITYAWSCLLV